VQAAAGIYGAIATEVDAAGRDAWNHRVRTSTLAKAWHIAHALWEAVMPPPKTSARPELGRRELAGRARTA
jgi:hypothetical protein